MKRKPRTLLIGMVSRLFEQKGFDILVEAASQLLQRDVQLAILGSGDEKYHAALQALGKYVFEVNDGANKMEIKNAVEAAFQVTVTGVNVVTIPGKSKRVGRRMVFNPGLKKAVVTLKPGDKIELFENVQ